MFVLTCILLLTGFSLWTGGTDEPDGYLKAYLRKTDLATILYEQPLEQYTLVMELSEQEDFYQWETFLIDSCSHTKITLLKETRKRMKNLLPIERDQIESNNYLYNIVGYYREGEHLYIVYDQWGDLYMYHFSFTGPKQFAVEKKLLFVQADNFNYTMLSRVVLRKIDSALYLLINSNLVMRMRDMEHFDLLNFIFESSPEMFNQSDLYQSGQKELPSDDDIEQVLQQVLSSYNKNSNIVYLDHIIDNPANITYFFYKDKEAIGCIQFVRGTYNRGSWKVANLEIEGIDKEEYILKGDLLPGPGKKATFLREDFWKIGIER